MDIHLEVQNIKCGGCAAAISQGLMEDERVEQVEVDIEHARVSVQAQSDIRADLQARLSALGYPPKA